MHRSAAARPQQLLADGERLVGRWSPEGEPAGNGCGRCGRGPGAGLGGTQRCRGVGRPGARRRGHRPRCGRSLCQLLGARLSERVLLAGGWRPRSTRAPAGWQTPAGRGAAIATLTVFGYLGFLAGPVLMGLLAEAGGLRTAMAVLAVLAAGLKNIAPANTPGAAPPTAGPANKVRSRCKALQFWTASSIGRPVAHSTASMPKASQGPRPTRPLTVASAADPPRASAPRAGLIEPDPRRRGRLPRLAERPPPACPPRAPGR